MGRIVTVDNLGPQDVLWTDLTVGAADVTMSWAGAPDALVLRRVGGPVTEAPTDGLSYGVGQTIGESTVRYANVTGTFPDGGLTPAANYYYRVFVKDTCGNWSEGTTVGPLVPGGVAEGDTRADIRTPVVGILNPSPGPVSPPVKVQVRVFSPQTTGGATQAIQGAVLSVDNGSTTTNHTLVRNNAYGTATDSGVYEVQLSATDLPAGRYTLRASATNGTGTVNSGAVWVVVGSGKGDGNLLVRDNSSQLCSDCHAHGTHASETTSTQYGSWYVACRSCHQPHNTPNASLVADEITPPALGGPKPPAKVYYAGPGGYSATGGAANPGAASYANADATGPCQVCHTRTAYYTRDGLGVDHNPGAVCTSCHSHARGLAASCTSCHGTPNRPGVTGADALHAAAPPAGAHAGETAETNAHVGEHQAHVYQTTYRSTPLACANCHTIPNQHNGSSDTLTFAGLGSTGTVATYVGGACSNYCHGATLGGGSTPSPGWATGDTMGCSSCHGLPPPAPHVARSDCGTCHGVGYSSSTVAKGTHINGSLNLDTMTCAGCHGDDTRVPVASATTLDANGNNIVLAAPPVDASNSPTGSKVGAHQPHANQGATGSPWTNAITCAVCHPVPTTATASGAHRDSLPSVAFTGTGAAAGASYSAGTCSSTYCHGNFAGGAGANPVSWGTGTPSKVACTSCHGGPPALSAASHHPNNTACATCHGVGYSTSAVVAATHVNKTVDKSRTGCTLCHGDLTATGVGVADGRVAPGYNANAADTTGGTAATSAGVGAHGKHLTSTTYIATPIACGNCHGVPTDPTDVTHATGGGTGGARATLSFSGLATSNNFGQITVSPAAYAGSTTNANGNTAGTCSNTYCHGNFTNGANATPSWTATGLTCNSCHGRTPGANPASPPGGTHPNDTNCGTCHTSYTGTSVNLALHMNGQKDYAGHPAGWKEPNQHGTGPSGALVSGLSSCTSCHTGFGPVGATASSSCNGCHASPSTYGPYTTGTYPNHTNWQTECTFCHGGRDSTTTGAPPRDTTIISTDATVQATTLVSIGAHSSHVGIGANPTQSRHGISQDLSCQYCHGSVPTDITHVNGGATAMGFANVGPTPNPGTYSGGASPTCSSTYCHGNFTGGAGAAPVGWTGTFGASLTLTCASCHGAPPPITVDHPQNTACGSCHGAAYSGTTVAAATHVDGSVTLEANRTGCVACHGTPGRASVTGADANQAAAPPIAANSGNTNAVGAHTAHTNVIGVRSPLACSECHTVPLTGDRTHIDGSTNTSVNFPVGGLARSDGANPGYSGGTCNGVYCHTRAGASTPAPGWTATLTGCTTCHGSPPPQTAGHPQRSDCDACHGVGYSSTVVSGTALGTHVNGTLNLVSTESCTSCHGQNRASQPNADAFQAAAPPIDTTNVGLVSDVDVGVHVQHVNSARSRPVACAECHTGEVPGAAQFNHATGTTTIAFGTLASTGGLIPGYSGGATPTCSATYCHGNFTYGNGAGATPVWTTQSTLACNGCHGAPPAHPHPGNSGCGDCHGLGYSISSVVQASHVDGVRNNLTSGCTACHGDRAQTGVTLTVSTAMAAPGYSGAATSADTAGQTATTSAGVGAHRAHLFSTRWRSTAIGCNECHGLPPTNADTAHALDAGTGGARALLTWGTLARGATDAWSPVVSPAYAGSSTGGGGTTGGTCATAYCHGAFPNGNSAYAPAWTGAASAANCGTCHGASATNPVPVTGHQVITNGTNCSTCHPGYDFVQGTGPASGSGVNPATHINGSLEGGISNGQQNCNGCHSTLVAAMNNTTSGAFHHYVNNANAPASATSYSTTLPGATTDATRTCTMCHVDHDLFNANKGANLRSALVAAPTATNTDFNGTSGICTSCHATAMTKSYAARTSSTQTPAIVAAGFGASAHDYAAQSSFGASTFNANCSKCHNDTMAKDKQTSANKFGTHDSTKASITDPLGSGVANAALEENFCYRCHSASTDVNPGGGPAKTTTANDYYGAVTTMSGGSTSIFAAMQKGLANVPGGAPTSTSNTLYFKPSAEETPPGTLPTAHLSTGADTFAGGTFRARSMSPYPSATAYEAYDTAAVTGATGTQNWRRVMFISPLVATAFTTSAAPWTINIYDREAATSNNARVRYAIYTINSSGTLKSSIVARTNFGTEMPTTAAPGGLQPITTANGTAVAVAIGDRIVVDLYVQTLTPTVTNPTMTLFYGNGAASNVVMPNNVTFTYPSQAVPGYGRHDVGSYSGLHRPSPVDETRAYIAANKHVECADCHDPHEARQRSANSFGSASGAGTTTTLVDSSKSATWTANQWVGAQVMIRSGARAWLRGTVTANTTTQLTFTPALASATAAGDQYVLEYRNGAGLATAGAATTLTDTTKAWQTNQWAGYAVSILKGTGAGQQRTVSSNTGTAITVSSAWTTAPNNTSLYAITRIPEAMTGATGVDVTAWGNNWLGPTTFNPALTTDALPVAVAQWQVCFKCHSSANGSLATWNANWTNLALEFNPNNQSYHPVVAPLPASDPGLNGSNRLLASQLINGWQPGQTMLCSDCHNTDAASPAAQGPHGSAIRYMLAGVNRAWPYTVAGATSGTLFQLSNAETGIGTQDGLFCRNCHPAPGTSGSGSNTFHLNGDVTGTGGQHTGNAILQCVRCHIRVPHGGKVSRLILTDLAPARYITTGATPNFVRFVKGATGTSYPTATNSTINTYFGSTCGQHSADGSGGELW